jgi:hypothetical protein
MPEVGKKQKQNRLDKRSRNTKQNKNRKPPGKKTGHDEENQLQEAKGKWRERS